MLILACWRFQLISNHLMSNATVATCGGNFYDPGGPSGQYGNNQNYTMTFVPATQGDRLKFTFSQFSVEANSSCSYDWLKIYNGPDIKRIPHWHLLRQQFAWRGYLYPCHGRPDL
jgi:hypothetical protein